MANPPDDDNVEFYSAFNGTDGATSLVSGEFFGATPTFLGNAAISDDAAPVPGEADDWPWVGNPQNDGPGTYLDGGSGGISLDDLTGAALGDEFYIECFFVTISGQNSDLVGLGAATAADKSFRIYYSNTGLFRIQVSLDGTNWETAQTIGLSNNQNINFIAIQRIGDRIGVWLRGGINALGLDPCDSFVANDSNLGNYQPGALHETTTQGLHFLNDSSLLRDLGYLNWTYITTEALYPDWPSEITVPACGASGLPRSVLCTPILKFPIPDVTIFNDETFEKDYSYYFEAPSGITLTFTASGLPSGLSMSTKGVLSGSFTGQTEGSTIAVTVTATNSCGIISDSFDITVGTVTANGAESYCTMHSGS